MELDEQPLILTTNICGYGGIGRRIAFRVRRRKACGFESLYPHHKNERCGKMPPRKRELKKLTDRELINLYFDNKVAMTNIHNVMGCNESWYDKYYAITHTFKREDIDAMDDKQLENLLKLAETIQEALY